MGLMLDKITLGYVCVDGNSYLDLMMTPIRLNEFVDTAPDVSQKLESTSDSTYLRKQVYSYLVSPGKGGTEILTKAILDILKCNRDVNTEDMNKYSVILMIIFEDDTRESVARVYNSIRSDITIINIKPIGNTKISSKDIYIAIDDLNDAGIDVVGLIIDSTRSIIPAEVSDDADNKFRVIMDDLVDVATSFDIPCITTWQLERNEDKDINSYFRMKDKVRKTSEEIFDEETIDEFKDVLGKYLPDDFTGVHISANYR